MRHEHLLVLAEERLTRPIAIEINDRKAGMAKTNTSLIKRFNAKAIGTTMGLNRCHVHKHLLVDPLV
jgi:hypothetical protein